MSTGYNKATYTNIYISDANSKSMSKLGIEKKKSKRIQLTNWVFTRILLAFSYTLHPYNINKALNRHHENSSDKLG